MLDLFSYNQMATRLPCPCESPSPWGSSPSPTLSPGSWYPAWVTNLSLVISSLMIFSFVFETRLLLAQDKLPKVQISTVDGSEFELRLEGIGLDQNISSPDLSELTVPEGFNLSEIVQINFPMETGLAAGDRTGNVRLHLINGSRILVQSANLQDENLTFRSFINSPPIPMEIVRAIVWSDGELVQQQLANPSNAEDTVIVQTDAGDRMVSGLVKKIDTQNLEIEYQGQVRKINIGRVKALVLADLGLEKEYQTTFSVNMSDGSLIKGEGVTLAQGALSVRLADGLELNFPQEQIRTIDITSDRLRYLSDLDPLEIQQRTLFTLQRQWQRDRSVLQNALAIRNHQTGQLFEFKKGLGTQAYTRLDFASRDNYQMLLATVGMAAETQGRGDCQMQVLGDGVELWSARIKGTDAPRDIEVDIRGVSRVSLVVDFGESLDLSDHANWCNARFVK
jgi:hypothetical protein